MAAIDAIAIGHSLGTIVFKMRQTRIASSWLLCLFSSLNSHGEVPMDDLSGRVALVTGASRGIGREIAMALAASGCEVAIGYNSNAGQAEAVVAAIKALGRSAVALSADVSNPVHAADLVAATERDLGPISRE
jgi:short subunit dehydrogenase